MQKHYYIDTDGTQMKGKTNLKHLSKVLDLTCSVSCKNSLNASWHWFYTYLELYWNGEHHSY